MQSALSKLIRPPGWNSRLGTGRSWTDTLCGPSKTTAFMVFSAILVQERALLSVWVPEGYLAAARSRSSIENLDERGRLYTTCWPGRTTFSLALSFRPGNRTSAAAVPASAPKGHLFDFCGERWAPGPGSSSVQSVTPCRFSALCGVRRGCVAALHVCVTSACPPTGRICFVASQFATTILNPRPAVEATGSRKLYVPSISGVSSSCKTARQRLSRNSVAGQWYNTDFPGNARDFLCWIFTPGNSSFSL